MGRLKSNLCHAPNVIDIIRFGPTCFPYDFATNSLNQVTVCEVCCNIYWYPAGARELFLIKRAKPIILLASMGPIVSILNSKKTICHVTIAFITSSASKQSDHGWCKRTNSHTSTIVCNVTQCVQWQIVLEAVAWKWVEGDLLPFYSPHLKKKKITVRN